MGSRKKRWDPGSRGGTDEEEVGTEEAEVQIEEEEVGTEEAEVQIDEEEVGTEEAEVQIEEEVMGIEKEEAGIKEDCSLNSLQAKLFDLCL